MLVVSLEQAVAAPHVHVRLADAGARVIKIERPEGDFARGYDAAVHGQSAYFVWLNRGKELVALDLGKAEDKALFEALLAKADVFIQNLKPGALARLGYPNDRLRAINRGLVICSISGYGEDGPYATRKAYDLLIQAETGLASVTGSPDAPGRVGVSVVDIATGAQRLCRHPRGPAAARQDRRGQRAQRLHVRRHGGLADRAAVAARGRHVAAPHGARASFHRALRRVRDQGRHRRTDLDPERPRMAGAGGASAR